MREFLNKAEEAMLKEARLLDQLTFEIQQEARRRILQKVPEFKQRNILMTALQLLLHLKQAGQLSKSEKKLWIELKNEWQQIDAIRQISNELERRAEEGNLPRNWRDDICWG
ncbi:hypothetical protein [Curvivirga aplysinae]|uniref:hypothetical protein n=1 Tax=Curvivirga aplysinae TaxID=2529852 RepID=UPI0012BB5B28|nr:hypothetical protein [Curvivirga aplysinae]MTI10273.1 hypothetical protein [Curvivirga aplysinae]